MDPTINAKHFRIGGMTCINCQNKIEKKLRNTAGIKSVTVSYSTGTADILYDTDVISPSDIRTVIEKLDYKVLEENERLQPGAGYVVCTLSIIVSLYLLLQQFGILNLLVPSRLADVGTGYGMLFLIGLLTSVHCVAMCGGINLSQCLPRSGSDFRGKKRLSAAAPALLYNLGRVVSYTAVGFLLGLAGFLMGGGSDGGVPALIQGILKLLAGIFMVLMGINMLGIFPGLRRLQPKIPRLHENKLSRKGPFFVGLLNGLMPCGPLQSVQIVALASGSPFAGALSMLLFSLGTVPLMLGLGSLVSALGKKFAEQVMHIGAILVVVLGLAMLSQGGSLSGLLQPELLLAVVLGLCAAGIAFSFSYRRPILKKVSVAAVSVAAVASIVFWNHTTTSTPLSVENSSVKIVDGKQVVSSTLSSGNYPDITVQAGTPVRWIITASEGSINGCNYKINIPEYGISDYAFQTGDNIIEFTPDEAGSFSYSCWMGMIRGRIIVTGTSDTKDAESSAQNGSANTSANAPVPSGYKIPVDSVEIADETTYEGYPIQEVTIQLTKDGFSPAVVIVKSELDVIWHIDSNLDQSDTQLLVPGYGARLSLLEGDNPLVFSPAESFDFSTGDNLFYGYVKVVEDPATADLDAIKTEVSNYETLIWPPETFQKNGSSAPAAEATIADGVQYVSSSVSEAGYGAIKVRKGIPVKWVLTAQEGSLNSCNNAIVIPEYDLQIELKTGENVIEFTPNRSGTFVFSCWMGMVQSQIIVTNEDGTVDAVQDDGSGSLPSCCG